MASERPNGRGEAIFFEASEQAVPHSTFIYVRLKRPQPARERERFSLRRRRAKWGVGSMRWNFGDDRMEMFQALTFSGRRARPTARSNLALTSDSPMMVMSLLPFLSLSLSLPYPSSTLTLGASSSSFRSLSPSPTTKHR